MPYYIKTDMTNFVSSAQKNMMYLRVAPGVGERDVALLPSKWMKDAAHAIVRTFSMLEKLTSGPVWTLKAGWKWRELCGGRPKGYVDGSANLIGPAATSIYPMSDSTQGPPLPVWMNARTRIYCSRRYVHRPRRESDPVATTKSGRGRFDDVQTHNASSLLLVSGVVSDGRQFLFIFVTELVGSFRTWKSVQQGHSTCKLPTAQISLPTLPPAQQYCGVGRTTAWPPDRVTDACL